MNQRNLDIENPVDLLKYLRGRGLITCDESPAMSLLAGGVSNRTVLIRRASGEGWVAKQALEKLRVAVDWFSSPERIHREALALRWLPALAPSNAIVPLVCEDHEAHIVIMAAVPEPHENWKTILLRGEVQDDHIRQFAHLLASIQGASRAAGDELASAFDDATFFESLRLEPYYRYACMQVPEAEFLSALIEETRMRRLVFTHGDFSPKNVLIHDGRLYLLDHEVAHYGDPAFDVGFAMTHFLSKAHRLEAHRSRFLAAALLFWMAYRDRLGDVSWDPDIEEFAVKHTLGCLLARVAGRSPLEYLTLEERLRQQQIVLSLSQSSIVTVPALVEAFGEGLEGRYAAY